MARALACCLVAALAAKPAVSVASQATGTLAVKRESSLLQTWDSALGSTSSRDTPVTRVVKLLKEMQTTLQKDMDEDKGLYKQLKCWCNENLYEKTNAIEAAKTKITELEASIESLSAKSQELKVSIKELQTEVAANKQTLAEATSVREKELEDFRSMETDNIQALEDLKGAIAVLSKHQAAFPQLAMSFLAISSKDEPRDARSLDAFMATNGISQDDAPQKFLRRDSRTVAAHAASSEWSEADVALVRHAMKSASALLQARHQDGYVPAYNSQSGEIFGILEQMKEEMEGDLKAAQEQETRRASAFAELRSAKTAEIEAGEAMIEEKQDTLATTDNNLAEAKEDLGQQQAFLAENQEFVANLQKTCDEADKNFEERRKARLAEIQAVSETIEILTGDEARDAMSGTFSFIQVSTQKSSRRAAAAVLRRAAQKSKSPMLSVMATSVELDSFSKVKEAIDSMIGALKEQQEDEVKKNDWCKKAIQENEMLAAKATDRKADLETRVGALESTIKTLESDIASAHAQIEQVQLALQKASEDRLKENHEYQTTFADQTVTVQILRKALDKLAKFYDTALVQRRSATGQAPPVPQAEYKPSQGAAGVMQMIQKLIGDANKLIEESQKTEVAAQSAYEQLVEDSNAAVNSLQTEIATKTDSKAQAIKEKLQTESDVADTVKEILGLSNENGELHKECDYVLKNFGVRQEARQQEVESLQQAKQILSGASLQ